MISNRHGVQATQLRFSAAGDAASMMDGAFTTKRRPVSEARQSSSAAGNYGFVVGLGLLALILSAILAFNLATDPVLLAWASPV